MRGVEDNGARDTTDGSGNGDGHDPGEDEETDSLPVDGLEGAVAETNTDGGSGDAHGGGDGERVLREDEDGESGTHLHGATSAGRVVCDLVTHDLHDVVAVGDETERQGGGEHSQLPKRDGSLGCSSVTGVPGRVDDSPGTDSVTDIVGTVGEGSSAGGDDLDERVGVLNFVGVLLSVAVDALHALAFGCSVDTGLSSVDVVVDTVKAANDNHGGNALESDDHVLLLVDLAIHDLVLVEVAHGPSEGTSLVPKLGVEAVLTLSDELLVAELAVLSDDSTLLGVGGVDAVLGVAADGLGLHLIVVLDDSVVGDDSTLSTLGSGAAEEKGAKEGVVPADGVIALDDLGVEVRNEKEEREKCEANTDGDGDSSDIPRRLLVKTEVGRSLVDDGECADGASDEKEEGRSPDGNWNGVLAKMDRKLDQHEDDGTEACRGSRSHSKTSEDSTKTLALVPSPLDLGRTSNGNTDTSNGRDKRVGRRDVSRMLGAPHDPDGGTGESAREGKHLNTGVVPEGAGGDDAVLDGIGSTGTDSDGTDHLKDGTKDHGLAVGDGPRRD